MPQLIEVRWDSLEYGIFDVIQGWLVEDPDSYYIAPNRRWLCYLTREYGLIQFVHDFTMMSDEEISAYIIGAIELLYGEEEE